MALESHIAELRERHQSLEREIERELNHPASDTLRIAEMKKQKLRLKEEIERLTALKRAA
jgi:hypothetical protein